MRITEQDFRYVADVVRRRSAIVLEPGKEYLVEARLASLARQLGIASLGDLVAQMRTTPVLAERVVAVMTTNETSFFRDTSPFEALREEILPELVALRMQSRRLAIWSAACSSGQEPYSVAMLLDQGFPELRGWDVSTLCTDLSPEMVERCRQGRYSTLEVNRGLPASMLVRYFEKQGVEYQVQSSLRSMMDARLMNLAAPSHWPSLRTFDLVLMRNVLIYFDVKTKREVLKRVGRVLHPDGYLFLGAAETTLDLDDIFERVQRGRAGCYRLRKPPLSPGTRLGSLGAPRSSPANDRKSTGTHHGG